MVVAASVLLGFLAFDAAPVPPKEFGGVNPRIIERAIRDSITVRPGSPPQRAQAAAEPRQCSIPLKNLLKPGPNPDPAMVLPPPPAKTAPMPNIMPAPPCPERP